MSDKTKSTLGETGIYDALQVAVKLLHAAGSDYHRRHHRVPQYPSQRHLRQSLASLAGKSVQSADIFEQQLKKCGVDYFDFYLLLFYILILHSLPFSASVFVTSNTAGIRSISSLRCVIIPTIVSFARFSSE